MTTTQNLSTQEQCLLTNFQELTDDDRKMVTAFIQHILDLSLAKRSYNAVLRELHIVDYAQRPRA
jgi:hypothetical protein